MPPSDPRRLGLLYSEQVLWEGRPAGDVPRDRVWLYSPLVLLSFGTVAGLFALLLHHTGIPAFRETAAVGLYFGVTAVALTLVPRYLFDRCTYVLTDARVILRRGASQRSMDRRAITFARIRWHRSVPGVGHLELVRAVPFGPLSRKQRLLLRDVERPDILLARIRGATPGEHAGDGEVDLAERLERGEQVLWGAGPEGWLFGWRDVSISLLGAGLCSVGLLYGYRVAAIVLGLEDLGLQVRSWTWALLFLATSLSWATIMSIGVGLLWHGVWRARELGRHTEYMLTNRRLLIRRGRTELSVDRRRIVDVVDTPGAGGGKHLFLILDAPHARALADSGALGTVLPGRDSVPPILYDLSHSEGVRDLILSRISATQALEAAE